MLTQLQTLRLSPAQQKLPIFRALHSTQVFQDPGSLPPSERKNQQASIRHATHETALAELTRERVHLLWLYPSLVKCIGLDDPAVRQELQAVMVLVGECLGLQ